MAQYLREKLYSQIDTREMKNKETLKSCLNSGQTSRCAPYICDNNTKKHK